MGAWVCDVCLSVVGLGVGGGGGRVCAAWGIPLFAIVLFLMFFYLGNHSNHGPHEKVGTADGTGPPDGTCREAWGEVGAALVRCAGRRGGRVTCGAAGREVKSREDGRTTCQYGCPRSRTRTMPLAVTKGCLISLVTPHRLNVTVQIFENLYCRGI